MILEVLFVRVKTERKAMCLLKGKDRVGEVRGRGRWRPPLLGFSEPSGKTSSKSTGI